MANSWVIIANGPSYSENELLSCIQNKKVLVLDGAINRFKGLSFYPHYLLGDFDSIEDPAYWGVQKAFSEASSPYLGHFGITIVRAQNQNYTDLEKAIQFCDKTGASSIHIVQAIGGRLDHTLGSLGFLKKYTNDTRPLIILTEKEQILYVCNKAVFIEGGMGENCAILGYPEAWMTTQGLAYNGTNYPLKLGFEQSLCNTIKEPKASIFIQGEALLILPKASTFTLGDL